MRKCIFLCGYAALIALICSKHIFGAEYGALASCAGSILSDYNVLFLFGLAAYFLSNKLSESFQRYASEILIFGGIGLFGADHN